MVGSLSLSLGPGGGLGNALRQNARVRSPANMTNRETVIRGVRLCLRRVPLPSTRFEGIAGIIERGRYRFWQLSQI